ncbi:MAG: phage holin family protein [Acidobacteria bacterium]|nr:phage holin family protein [Acidobacteriota bacterium]
MMTRETGQVLQKKQPQESLGDLLGDLVAHSAGLVQDEFRLARQEISEKAKLYKSALILLAFGGVISFVAFLSFSSAIVLWLSTHVEPWLAAVITGAGLAVIGIVILLLGASELSNLNLKPEKTLRTLEENKEWLKDIT